MNSQDLKLVGKIGELVSHFAEEWSEYQDWLGDIIASYSVLRQRYPAWQTMMIFRWRLGYFVAYVGTVIAVNQLLRTLNGFPSWLLEKNFFKFTILSTMVTRFTQFTRLTQYHYILQRTATLLAVIELTICAIAAFTGILLAFYYQPTALGAYKSLTMIVNEVTNGSLILSLHNLAGHGLIVVGLIQIVVMFLGRQFLLSWLTAWISGICLALTAISLSWTAIILNWEQTSFWRLKIELSIVESIPLVGSNLREILSGGNSISSITLQHMYALHSHILVIAAIFCSIAHLTALIFQEQHWKPKDKRFRITQLCSEYPSKGDSTSA
jgi:quinol-cytochrome oxidoreductase complex cytochrome b subunit